MYNLTIFIKNVFRYQTANFNNRKTTIMFAPTQLILQVHKKLLFFFLNFIYFWLCWILIATQVFPSCGKQRLLSSCGVQASHCGGFSCCSSQPLEHRLQSMGSVVAVHDLAMSWHVESSKTRTESMGIGRQTLNH